RIEIAADEAEFLHAALQLRNAVRRRHARTLRKLAHTDELLRVESADAPDQLVAMLRPVPARGLVADVMAHTHCTRREDRNVGAAVSLQLQLRALEARADRVVADSEAPLDGSMLRILEPGDLPLAPFLELLGSGRVVAVAIDDHVSSTQLARHVVEQFLHGKAPRNHTLLVDSVDDDLEAAPVRLEAERMGVEFAGLGKLRRLLALGEEP